MCLLKGYCIVPGYPIKLLLISQRHVGSTLSLEKGMLRPFSINTTMYVKTCPRQELSVSSKLYTVHTVK